MILKERYEQPILCENCRVLCGFSTYGRDEFQCLKCRKPTKKELKDIKGQLEAERIMEENNPYENP
jgi:hypothetical protein